MKKRYKEWADLVRGDLLVLHQTYVKNIDTSLLNYWVISENEKIRGGQLIVSKKDSAIR